MPNIVTVLKKFHHTGNPNKNGTKVNAIILWTLVFVTLVVTIEYQMSVVAKLHRFFTVLHGVLSEFKPTISQVGKHVAELIDFLVSEGSQYINFHVLGASLGAHVAGYVGHYTKGQIGRITGLDPSGPLFHSVPLRDRLDPSDAHFVDIIHTAGKWVGNSDISGHVDYFPNLGLAPQPGCEGRESLDLSCSHRKAWQMFAESIKDTKNVFFAVNCPSAKEFAQGFCCHSKALLNLAIMGESAHNQTRGTFYLFTNEESPLAMEKEDGINCHF